MADQDPDSTGEQNPPSDQAPKPDDRQEAYYRRQWEKLKGEHDNLKRSLLSEAERTKAERDEARADAQKAREEAKNLRVMGALEKAAAKAGAHDLDAVAKLADHGKLQVTDDGEILGIDAALKDLQKNRPYLFGPTARPSTGSGGGRTSNGSGDKGSVARRMDDAIRSKVR